MRRSTDWIPIISTSVWEPSSIRYWQLQGQSLLLIYTSKGFRTKTKQPTSHNLSPRTIKTLHKTYNPLTSLNNDRSIRQCRSWVTSPPSKISRWSLILPLTAVVTTMITAKWIWAAKSRPLSSPKHSVPQTSQNSHYKIPLTHPTPHNFNPISKSPPTTMCTLWTEATRTLTSNRWIRRPKGVKQNWVGGKNYC